MTAQQLAAMIDHTILKPETTAGQVEQVCEEAVEYGFCAVCVNPIYVPLAANRLKGSKVKTAGVAGFPLGSVPTATKVAETQWAIEAGATEIDMVLHLGGLVAGEKNQVRDDIAAVAEVVHAASPDYLLKVILETAVLTQEQIILGCRCVVEAQADFVKTSTGFHPAGGASVTAVHILKRHASLIRVKASGGIRDLPTALTMIEAGADRLGCSSSVAIIKELLNRE